MAIRKVVYESQNRREAQVNAVLNKYGIKLNRGKHSGPIKKKGERKNSQDNKVEDNQ